MCPSAHMNSREIAVHNHKDDIKANRLIELPGQCCQRNQPLWELAPFRPCAVATTVNLRRGEMASLRAILPRSSSHEIVEYDAIRRLAQFLEEFRPSKSSGDASQRVELCTLVFF